MSSLMYIVLLVMIADASAFRKKFNTLERVKRQTFTSDNKVCGKIADLAFVIDSSGSLGQAAFNKELRFVRQVLSEFDISSQQTRVAVITFGSFVQQQFHFNDYNSESEVLAAVSRITYEGGPATLTYKAINQTRVDIFSVRNGERPDVPNIAIVVTDGGTNPGRVDPYTKPYAKGLTQTEAAQLKRMGVNVFSIGVGPYIDPVELMGICNTPPDQFYLQVDTFDRLNTKVITDMVVHRSCEAQREPPPPQLCKTSSADIVFILDKSTSLLNKENFQEELKFVNGVVRSLAIGPNDVQVSVITFSNDAHFEFALNAHSDSASLQRAVSRLEWTKGDTYTHKALDMMLNKAFNPAFGARPNEKKIGVIITDGASTNPFKTENSSRYVHARRDIEMFAIGVGDSYNKDELQTMASTPKDEHVFEVNSVRALQGIVDKLSDRFCGPIATPRPRPRPRPRPTPRPTPRPSPNVPDCRYRDMDVMFILDKSTSLRTQTNFNKELVFVNDFLEEVDVDSGAARVGLMTFSDDPKMEFYLNTYNTEFGVKNGLMAVRYTYGNTYTDKAFKMLLDEGFITRNGARPGVEKVVIIITDGRSTDPYSLRAIMELVRRNRINVFAIGVGPEIDDDELAMMASEPDSVHVFRVDDLNALASIQVQLAARICGRRSP